MLWYNALLSFLWGPTNLSLKVKNSVIGQKKAVVKNVASSPPSRSYLFFECLSFHHNKIKMTRPLIHTTYIFFCHLPYPFACSKMFSIHFNVLRTLKSEILSNELKNLRKSAYSKFFE